MLRRSVPALLACLAVVGANVTTPSEAQLKWQDFEVGAMITWNLQTLCTQVKARASAQRCQVGGSGFVPNLDATMQWNPTKLDTDKWVRVAKSFGAKYIVLVADHMTGFTLWDTKAHNFSMAHTKWRGGGGDVVQEFVASCRKYGVAPGLFYSSHFNWNLGVNDYMVGWPRLNGGPQLTQTEFDKIVQQQLEELLQNYGDIVEIWFDGGVNNSATPSVGPTVNRLAPNAVCHSCAGFSSNGLRWMGNEEGVMPLPSWGACDPDLSPFTGDPLGSIYAPPSTDTVLDEHYWFWTPDAKSHRVTTKQLVSRYLTSVGRSSNLILNMAPDDMGDIGDDDVAAYDAFGKAITCLFSERVSYTTDVNVEDGSATWGVKVESMSNGAFNLSLHVMEDISTGQLIGNWSLFASMESPSSTATLSLLSNETAIGHKRILNIVTPPTGHRETITELRLVVWDNYAGPGQSMRLRSVEVFDWSAKQSCV